MSKIITVDCRSKKQKKIERLEGFKTTISNVATTTIKAAAAVVSLSFYLGVLVGGVVTPFKNGK